MCVSRLFVFGLAVDVKAPNGTHPKCIWARALSPFSICANAIWFSGGSVRTLPLRISIQIRKETVPEGVVELVVSGNIRRHLPLWDVLVSSIMSVCLREFMPFMYTSRDKMI